MGDTTIEWTAVPDGKGGFKKGATLNPQVGCREVSPACRHCYAAGAAHRGMSPQHKGLTVVTSNGVHWNGEVSRTPAMLAKPLSWREPRGIFLGSMTDTFLRVETDADMRWIAAQFGVMAVTPRHTWMVLTKRPENAAKFFAWLDRLSEAEYRDHVDLCCEMAVEVLLDAGDGGGAERLADIHGWALDGEYFGGFDYLDRSEARSVERRKRRAAGDADGLNTEAWPLANVWIGTTVEDQQRADERIPLLLALPAAVRFLSCEPLLGDLNLREWLPNWKSGNCPIDWIIAGGESGPKARPMHPDWARGIRDQCVDAGVPYFFKQWGEFQPYVDEDRFTYGGSEKSSNAHTWVARKGDFGDCWIYDDNGSWTNWTGDPGFGPDRPDAPVEIMARVGKAAAGRELDGRTWDEFPEAAR